MKTEIIIEGLKKLCDCIRAGEQCLIGKYAWLKGTTQPVLIANVNGDCYDVLLRDFEMITIHRNQIEFA